MIMIMLGVAERATSKEHDVRFNAGAGLIPDPKLANAMMTIRYMTKLNEAHYLCRNIAALPPRAGSSPLVALGEIEFCAPLSHSEQER